MKKIIRFTEQDLSRIVSETIKKVLNEYDIGTLSLDTVPNDLRIEFIGRNDILKIVDILWNMLTLSYEKIGGLKTYRDKDHFISMVRYAKIVYYEDEIVACAIYRKIEASYKMVAIGCNQDQVGKLGIQAIVKDDISKFDGKFWAEVSEAIEHYFKKYNGYPMPNSLAPQILGIPSDSIRLSSKDNAHYERVIGGSWYEKMIFGIKSEEIYEAVLKAVDDYSTFMREVNTIEESSNHLRYSIKQAVYITENILRAHEEDGFNEMVPSWQEALTHALDTFKWAKENGMIQDYVDDYIEYCEYLFKDMQPLVLHELTL